MRLNRAPLARVLAPAALACLAAACGGSGPEGNGAKPGLQNDEPAGSQDGGGGKKGPQGQSGYRLPMDVPPPSPEQLEAAVAEAARQGFEPLTVDPPMYRDVTGRYGGTVTWSEVAELATFNPTVSSTAFENELKDLVFDKLVSYENGVWKDDPALAWKYESSPDYLTWTFHLRKGIKWSDGKPFTAKDVLFTFDVTFDDKVPTSDKDGFRVGDADFPKLSAPDDYTVVFELPVVNSLFLMQVGNCAIIPAHKWKAMFDADPSSYPQQMTASVDPKEIIGTGPFKVVSSASGERAVYERNPYSWRQDREGNRLPYLEGCIVLINKDLSVRTTQFLDGAFDLITSIPIPDYERVKAREKEGAFKVWRPGLSLNTNWVCLNQHPGKDAEGKPFVAPHKLKWFQDVRFRRAISHASDREGLVKTFLDGKGEAIYGQTNRSNKTHYAETTKYPHDPKKAAAILDEMGLTDRNDDGVREDADGNKCVIELATNLENPMRVRIISQLKSDWNAVGIEVITRPLQFQELVHRLQDGHNWEGILLGWGSGVPPDPMNGKNIHLSSGRLHAWHNQQESPVNEWEIEGDRLITQIDHEPDTSKHPALWKQYLEHFAQGQNMTYLFSQNMYCASKFRVQNLRKTVLRPQLTFNIVEIWVDDSK